MTTLADLKAALDVQAHDIPPAEEVLARARTRRPPGHRGLFLAAAAVVALVASVVVVVLHGGSTAEPADHGWKTFHTGGFSVSYPPEWHAATYTEVSTFSAAIVFLSDQTMTAPCTTTSDETGARTSCRGGAVLRLEPGSVSVSWFNSGFPGRDDLALAPGEPTTIGGVEAKVFVGVDGACTALGGQTAIEAAVRRPDAEGNYLHMYACVAAPRNSKQVAQVLRSLHSMRQ